MIEADINVSQLPVGIYSFAVSNATEPNTCLVVIE